MSRMLSTQSQCCCCSASVFSALFGTIMAATGISLVLNYRITEVDTGGLPPELQNDEGKKIVGIILICCGFGSMGISALIATVYFTVCSRPKVRQAPDKVTKSATPPSQTGTQHTDQYSHELPHRRNESNSRHGKRSKKRKANLKQYKNRLAPHQEVINEGFQMSLSESPRSIDSSQTGSSKSNSISTQGELPDIFQKTFPGNPPVQIRIDESSPEPTTRETNVDEKSSRSSPELHSEDTTEPGIPHDPAVKADPSELPALASVRKEEEEGEDDDDEDVSQIEEVKQLDKYVLGHMAS